MRAQLARHARRVLIQQVRSPSCAVYSAPLRRRCTPRAINNGYSKRFFLDGLFAKAPREIRQPEFEPGWQKIMIWRSRMLDNLRPPPTEELVQAWKSFFEGKLSSRMALNGTQAMQCRRLLEYLVKEREFPTQAKIEIPEILKALNALESLRPRERTEHHLELARALWSAINNPKLQNPNWVTGGSLWSQYLTVLCTFGGSKEALEIAYAKWNDIIEFCKKKTKNPILSLADGLARDGCEEDLVELINYAEKNGYPYDKHLQRVLITYYAQQNRVPETKQWFEKPLSSGSPSNKIIPLIATFAARNNLEEWAIPYFLEIGNKLNEKPEKHYWDCLLQAILIIGKGLPEVEKMISHMESSQEIIKTNTATINSLLRAALGMKDSLLAEEILSLATDRGIPLDGESHLIFMEMRLQAGYLPGVHAAYKKVTHHEPWHIQPDLWWDFGRLVNEYMMILTTQSTPNFKIIGEIIEMCEENQVLLEPETVASLCIRFLENEQHFEVMDILSVHSFQFSAAEREIIQDAFTHFCVNPQTSTSRAWNGYQILRQFFQDLSFEHRAQLMEAFFERNRPDMASHVFGHMRQHRNNDYHPKRETYISCFEGFSRCPDKESLDIVYNMLKMDTTVEPNTQLYTSLLLAHAACGKTTQAMDFWQAITASQEGPSYASLEAVFWALERTPNGSSQAQTIWKRIKSMDIDVPPVVYNAYIGAIAGSGEETEVKDLILRMSLATGGEPDAMTLGIAFNALPGQTLQSNFKGWAQTRYPEAWANLESKGKRLNKDSLCQYKLNRIMRA
ncbi:complex I intermediate-associated CIA84 precursor [Fusarium beomiforme]|uniref:Complex I intermediate-associated CIA84 n=1 Tax=Fusarium beomiforme TaxID=44412 RepID=A0A9P5DZ62_9HYPO|nr:complex I intermediate-associated CIA84 precursor [Fusarium beomiforme]